MISKKAYKAKVYSYKKWIPITDSAELFKIFDDALMESGHTIIDFVDHNFKPQGYTALWLLSESHFAVHSFPEHNMTYIELSSCSKKAFIKFKKIINRFQN